MNIEVVRNITHPESTGENRWKPVLNLRPHHLTNPEIRGALIGKNILFINFDGPRLRREYPEEVDLYQADTYGVGSDGEEMLHPIKAALTALKDDHVIKVGIEKDPICTSCQIGQHCDATNYVLFGVTQDRLEREKTELDKVHKELTNAGYIVGADFIFEDIQYRLLDYRGAGLWDQVIPTPEIVNFQSMLVKVEALRKIFTR